MIYRVAKTAATTSNLVDKDEGDMTVSGASSNIANIPFTHDDTTARLGRVGDTARVHLLAGCRRGVDLEVAQHRSQDDVHLDVADDRDRSLLVDLLRLRSHGDDAGGGDPLHPAGSAWRGGVHGDLRFRGGHHAGRILSASGDGRIGDARGRK